MQRGKNSPINARVERYARNQDEEYAMPLLTPRRRFIQTLALTAGSLPIGLRPSLAGPADQPGPWQIQRPLFRVHFSPLSGKLSVQRKGAPLLTNAVARAITAVGARSTSEHGYTRHVEVKPVADVMGPLGSSSSPGARTGGSSSILRCGSPFTTGWTR